MGANIKQMVSMFKNSNIQKMYRKKQGVEKKWKKFGRMDGWRLKNQAECLPCENIISTGPEIAQPRVNPWDKNPVHSHTGKAEGLGLMTALSSANYQIPVSGLQPDGFFGELHKTQGATLR